MIDIESEVLDTIVKAIRVVFPGVNISSEAVPIPSSFPHISFVETDNFTDTRTMDTSYTENHARLAYEVNVYSNLSQGKKTQCKKIMAVIDTKMQEIGFLRIGKTPSEVPNAADKTIYRLIARYRATVSKDKIIYRR